MTSSTQTVTEAGGDVRSMVRSERRAFHRKWMEERGYSLADFDTKMVFKHPTNKSDVVGVFANQFTRKDGLFLELTDRDHKPKYPGRLYRIRPCANYEEEYEQKAPNSFYMPLEELEVVFDASQEEERQRKEDEQKIIESVEELKQKTEKLSDDMDDPITKETLRDRCAIEWRKPVSNKKWLNQLIRETFPDTK